MKYAVELSGTCGKFATLSTVSKDSGIATRAVQPFDVEFEGECTYDIYGYLI